MTKRFITIFAIAGFSLLFAELKIGYIDSNRIMEEFEAVQEVRVEVEKEQRKLDADMKALVAQYDSLAQDYERQRLLMSDDRRSEKELEIVQKEKEVQDFQLRNFGQDGTLYRRQAQLLKPIYEKIDEAIKKIGAEKGYDYIFDALSGAIVYAIDSHDLTDEVLEALQETEESN